MAVLLVACLAAGGCGGDRASRETSHDRPATERDPVVIGASGIGPVRLGMTLDEIEATGYLRSSWTIEPECGGGVAALLGTGGAQWGAAYLGDHGRVTSVDSSGEAVRTSEGLRVGDPVDQVVRTYGEIATLDTDETTVDIFGYSKVTVEFDDSDRASLTVTIDPETSEVNGFAVPLLRTCA